MTETEKDLKRTIEEAREPRTSFGDNLLDELKLAAEYCRTTTHQIAIQDAILFIQQHIISPANQSPVDK